MARRGGFTLVEAIVALVLLAFGAVAAASAEAWAARACALAERREDGAAAAELLLDSLAQAREPTAGSDTVSGMAVAWNVVPGGGAAEVRLRVTRRFPPGSRVSAGAPEEIYAGIWAAPPVTPGGAP